MRLLLSLLLFLPSMALADDGVLPVGTDGKPLNLDFETGTLKDWTATGDAFKDQPIKGDTVAARRGDMRSRHQGQWWIGGYEKYSDKPVGTLTSVAFKVTHPWASFLVAGGPHENTRVELIRTDTKAVFFKTSGSETEELSRVAVDLRPLKDKEIFIRIVDQNAGPWGHVNFDDFRFHAEEPKIAPRPKATAPDAFKYAGLPPEEAAKAMTVPKGFSVKLFAGEPDVHQPIAMCTDDRGRLWVVEAYAYPKRLPFDGPLLPEAERKKGDKILIFEDTDGDGKFDKRTTFIEGLNLVSGIELGFGGVWVGAAPYFMFIPHDQATDKAGEPKILLDGWGYQDTHETLNSFIWGPDGWLYGCHGVFTHSRVGKPGTPDKDRTPINAGIWRYHPTKHEFEVFAQGTSNPWGLDFNEHGEAFVEACVIPHMWHIIQGGRYQRQAGFHFNPYTYADIPTIAKHRHYVGATPHSGNGRSDEVGGGHAHSGLLCYQGGLWPKEYHGKLFMGNIHGHRLNVDVITPKGSGYEADRNPDFLLTNDRYSLIVGLQPAPDGNVYMIDWYDKQTCHRPEPEIWDRTNGRVYKIVHESTIPVKGLDLQKLSDEELVKLQLSDNEWMVRHSRRILQERVGIDTRHLRDVLKVVVDVQPGHDSKRLRLMWLVAALDEELTMGRLQPKQPDSPVQAYVIRMLMNSISKEAGEKLQSVLQAASRDNAPVSHRVIASGLGKLPLESRIVVLKQLLSHAEEAADHNLPLLYWYALESVAEKDPATAMKLATEGKIPLLVHFTARRIATTSGMVENDLLAKVIGEMANSADPRLATLLDGVNDGFKGRRNLGMPEKWSETMAAVEKTKDARLQAAVSNLAAAFGDPKQLAKLRQSLTNTKLVPAIRLKNLDTLLNAQDKELAPVLRALLDDNALRGAAIRGLAGYDDPAAPAAILAKWKTLNLDERRDAQNTLAARPASAKALLKAIEEKVVSPADVSADVIRSMRNLPDKTLAADITRVWGTVRDTPVARQQAMREMKTLLAKPGQPKPDLMLGRALFAKTCQQCHKLFGVGGAVGPDITGSNRANLDYLLENILDPSAVIPKDYMPTVFQLANGRTITGIVKGQNANAVTVQTANEVLVVNIADIDSRKETTVSMMPEDQLKPFKEHEIRSLFAYLQNPAQTSMLATVENSKDFFNGKDLTGWIGKPELWSVENGEIVGKTDGLKRNEFLRSELAVENFKLTLQVKLTPNKENSGVQFRSEALPDGEMRGYQADVGAGWWGKLYEESGRGLLWDKSGEAHVKSGEWNTYEIVADGSSIKTFINGKACVDLTDEPGAKRGIFGLQLHSGGAMEVRYKDLKLQLLEAKK
ncbi:PVC-type heme-binding CxxCH protein [Zavarzinella formosa]|uniref:PVC-type heme-binding CxxCH protein n=1 Tax=Zavarzinella formosa TaxID=360055 RepID=UPI0002E680B1|nr:PVC-type heme-binding CxxCH protein [Zavarzinella formosa]